MWHDGRPWGSSSWVFNRATGVAIWVWHEWYSAGGFSPAFRLRIVNRHRRMDKDRCVHHTGMLGYSSRVQVYSLNPFFFGKTLRKFWVISVHPGQLTATEILTWVRDERAYDYSAKRTMAKNIISERPRDNRKTDRQKSHAAMAMIRKTASHTQPPRDEISWR